MKRRVPYVIAAFVLALLLTLPACGVAFAQASESVTVSSFYGAMTVTPDSVFYTTPTREHAVSRDLIAALVRPDMIAEGRTLPDRSDPWAVEDVEAHLVFADHEHGPLPPFPPLAGNGAATQRADSLEAVVAAQAALLGDLEAAAADLAADYDSVAASYVVLSDQYFALQSEHGGLQSAYAALEGENAALAADLEAASVALAAAEAAVVAAEAAQAEAEAARAQAEQALAAEIANRQAIIDAAVAEQTAAMEAELVALRAERAAVLAEVQRNNSRLAQIIQSILSR